MRCSVPVVNSRRILCVFPRYAVSFGTFQHSYKLMYRVKAFMPPQGLLLIAAYLPQKWSVRIVDENIAPASAADFAWADAVLVSGMHIQAGQIENIRQRAHAAGKATVLGGPSVSASPEMYPAFDYLHIGELGDATDRIVRLLDADSSPQPQQRALRTVERLALGDFPLPAYDKIPLGRYMMATLQFSSGCPYLCEFCDIPGLYGRQPRLKSPEQILAELDFMRAQPDAPAALYFVDDNFIGNRKAAKEMLPHLIEWQRKHEYPMQFACEATLNIAKQSDILELMREASFGTIFCGIETPDAEALIAMRKSHNNSVPMMEAIKTLNGYGMEVTSGIILGLDTDGDDTESRLIDFIDLSNVPILTINLLQALPKTPLWDRLEKAGRIESDAALESNVRFLRPYDQVLGMWRRAIGHANAPEHLFERLRYQVEATYANRKVLPPKGRLTWPNIRMGLVLLVRSIWYVGIVADYRRSFWRAAWHAIRKGQIDAALSMAFVGHHMVEFTREALRGDQNASFYSAKKRSATEADEEQQSRMAA